MRIDKSAANIMSRADNAAEGITCMIGDVSRPSPCWGAAPHRTCVRSRRVNFEFERSLPQGYPRGSTHCRAHASAGAHTREESVRSEWETNEAAS